MNRRSGENNKSCGKCCTKLVDLCVSFGGYAALEHINLHIHCGEVTAIVGPNGAGKSTLFKALIGVVPMSGEIVFTDMTENRTLRPKIGYVPQSLDLDKNAPINVADLFAVSRGIFPAWLSNRRADTEEMLSAVDAEHLIDRRIGALSGGELQRVLLALALRDYPDILLLDEPVSGMDINGSQMFYRVIDRVRKEFDLTILLISHDHRRVAKIADRIVLLNRTVLASGRPQEVLSSEAYREIFGGDADA